MWINVRIFQTKNPFTLKYPSFLQISSFFQCDISPNSAKKKITVNLFSVFRSIIFSIIRHTSNGIGIFNNWSIPGYLAFLTSRNRFVSLPFFFFFSPFQKSLYTSTNQTNHFACTKPYKETIFTFFFLRNFIGKSVSDLDEWKLFRLAYIYIRGYFLHDRKSNLILIYWFHEWMNMEINMHASNRSFAHLTWKLS